MKKIFLNALIISLVIILGTFSIQCFQLPQSYPVPNTSKESSVNLPDNIKTEKARLLQSKYFYKMIECARQLPFQIKEKSFQFIENNENTY